MKKRWYAARIIVQCNLEANVDGPWTCDEQIRILRALTDDEAYERALELGKEEEVAYRNMYGEEVRWEFVGIADLQEILSVLRDGTEVMSRLITIENPSEQVIPKEQLTVYRVQGMRGKTALEILNKRM